MKRLTTALLAVFIGALHAAALAPAAHAADISPGNWEITVTLRVPGVEQAFGPYSRTQCLQANDTKDPSRVFGTLPGAGTCQFSNRNDTGSRYSFQISCGGAFPMSGNGSVTYSAQTMEGKLVLGATLPSPEGGKPQIVNTRSELSGRRSGSC